MTSKLLSIPRELRHQIYLYCLTSPNGYFSIPVVKTGSRNNLALLLTCGQVYDEAKDIYFEQNSWEVVGEQDLFAFRFIPLKERLEERLGNTVKHIFFNLQPFHDFSLSNLTAACQLLSK
jgi:hypothetical protein